MTLTNRQQQVALLIAKGLSNEEIADELNITEGTTRNHVSAIYEVLGFIGAVEVKRVGVVHWVLRMELLTLGEMLGKGEMK